MPSHDSPEKKGDVARSNDVTHSRNADYPVLPGFVTALHSGGKYSPATLVLGRMLAYSSGCLVKRHLSLGRLLGQCIQVCSDNLLSQDYSSLAKSHVPVICSWLVRLLHCGGAAVDPTRRLRYDGFRPGR